MAVVWASQAVADLLEIASRDRRLARRITQALDALDTTGRGDLKKLQGRDDEWRLRIGDWRAIYRYGPEQTISVLSVDNRRDAY